MKAGGTDLEAAENRSVTSLFESGTVSGLALPIALLGVLVVMLLPMPGWALDLLLTSNLCLTILLLLVTLGAKRALDLSVFPALLLLLTLCRLALNVATTRAILLSGDGGRLVDAFGNFVVGGDLVVGLIVFLILVIIQFVVITKGAGRISEVAARFTLDALPGKQMAIDAELAAGAIDDATARTRRKQLARETDFYGAMDGAGKFVRGDAIAGMLITAINLVGGVSRGTSRGMTLGESLTRYSVLTVGDGLISQIPALLIAVTAGILVTKSNSDSTLGEELESQLFVNRRTLWIGFGVTSLLALLPGLPKLPFLAVAIGQLVLIARLKLSAKSSSATLSEEPHRSGPSGSSNTGSSDSASVDLRVEDFLQRERAMIELGPRLLPLMTRSACSSAPEQSASTSADASSRTSRTAPPAVPIRSAKSLAERITALRKEIARERGLWIPPIRVRSQLQIPGEQYRIVISGRVVARGELRVDKLLAIAPFESAPGEPVTTKSQSVAAASRVLHPQSSSQTTLRLPGEETREPAFGLPARWIDPGLASQAEAHRFTVVDPANVLMTHLGEVLKEHGHELLTRESLKELLDHVREFAPTIVDELRAESMRMATLHQVLKQLAEDGVPLSDLALVLESIANHSPEHKQSDTLTDAVRADLGRLICQRYLTTSKTSAPDHPSTGELRVIAFEPKLETQLREQVRESQLAIGPAAFEAILQRVRQAWKESERLEQPLALLVDRSLRRPMRKLLRRSVPGLGVIAYQEIPGEVGLIPVEIIAYEQVLGSPAPVESETAGASTSHPTAESTSSPRAA